MLYTNIQKRLCEYSYMSDVMQSISEPHNLDRRHSKQKGQVVTIVTNPQQQTTLRTLPAP